MTIDERLERLADRHEALSHTVELLAADGEKTGERIRALAIIADQNEVRAARMMEAITSLARTVETHEHRLGDLER
jgi:predicted house-cleaning noncanonical NTP pyrophosphatase (MazG superfamily)